MTWSSLSPKSNRKFVYFLLCSVPGPSSSSSSSLNFTNDLPASVPSSVSCSLYADHLAIWSSSPSVPNAVEATQGALIQLKHWSEYWCLPLNPSKCEASFSVDPHLANLQPHLLLFNSCLYFGPYVLSGGPLIFTFSFF